VETYEYRHVVGFEETNVAGNVYYVNYLRWQGRARELFLKRCAPGVLSEIREGLAFVTTRCSCEYLAELGEFDEVVIRMQLGDLTQNRISMRFEYWRQKDDAEELVAQGEQQVACMLRSGQTLTLALFPSSLREALRQYV
jgi:enediyne biosynthesis thioesterase